MTLFHLKRTFPPYSVETPNARLVAGMFGLDSHIDLGIDVLEATDLEIEPGQLVYVTGASGSGKSVILKELRSQLPDCLDLMDQDLPRDRPVVDCFDADLEETFQWLALAGLSEAYALLRTPEELSDGQRYRLRLALALAQRPKSLIIDEFCATLDRVTAAVVAHNVRRAADRFDITIVVATSHDDLLEDLEPDVVVVKSLGARAEVFYPPRLKPHEVHNRRHRPNRTA